MSTSDEKDIMDLIKDNKANIPATVTCNKCGASKTEAELCASTGSFNIVPFGTEGSWIECYDSVACRKRMKASGKKEEPTKAMAKQEHNSKPWENKDNKFQSGFTSGFESQNFKQCRHYAKEAFSIGDMTFHGGSETKVEDQQFDQSWLVVSLLGHKTWNVKEYLWSKKKNFLAVLEPYVRSNFEPTITLDWPDRQAPPVKHGFWLNLVAMANKAGYKNILFYCIGGHGRTGTALSSVLVECADLSAFDAVKLVRKDYCKEAVETKDQVEYLEKLAKLCKKEVQ